jgi:hypothetical protein
MAEHWADKEIKKAAAEIDAGHYTPAEQPEGIEQMNGLGLALGLGSSGVAVGDKPTLDEFQNTNQEMQILANHPRVLEAMEKMRHEITELKGHELIEKNCALHELTEASERKNRWDGQGRWMGHDNEEMRYGKILSPQQFYDKLGKVTGKGSFKLSEHIMFPYEGARSGLSGIYMRNPFWDGAAERYREGERQSALAMADEAQKKFKETQSLTRLGRDEEAQKKLQELSVIMAEAHEQFNRAATGTYLAEPEFVRVGTIQWPLSTEWMILEFTEWGTVWKPKFYGWRTALLTMIRAGAITPEQAHKAFPVGSGEAAAWYLQQIFDFNLVGGVIH